MKFGADGLAFFEAGLLNVVKHLQVFEAAVGFFVEDLFFQLVIFFVVVESLGIVALLRVDFRKASVSFKRLAFRIDLG